MKYPEFRFGIFVVVGVLIMVGMVALVGLLLGMLPEGLTVRRAELALGAGFVAVVGYLVYLNRNWRAFVDGGGEKIYGFWSYLVIIVYILASLRSYLWLVGESNGWLVIGSPFNLGDLALHMHLTQFLASGVRFWPESPIILDQIIRYPIGIHLFGAVLLKIGVSIFCLMIWMGLIGSFLAGVSLWRWGGVFGLCVLLLSGGLAGFAIWEGDWKRETLFGPEWKNLFLSVFVTQRGFLWALPAGLVLLERWRGRFRGEKGVLPLWVEWILLGLMPLFHVHTFIFLVGLLVVCWLVSGGEERRVFFWSGCGAMVFAIPLFLLVTGGGGGNFIGWSPGWMAGGEKIGFWFWNFGFWLPMVFAVLVWVLVKGLRYEKLFVSYSVGVFAVCCFVRFAPWAWDNVKLMIWSFLVLGPFMWDMLKRVSFYLRAVLMVGLFWSGGVALWEGLGQHQMHRWLEVREIREAESVLRGIPAKRVRVATKPDVPHPVALCGYPVAMGYAGHLWSHGIEYRELEMALRELYCKGLRSGVLREVTHVFIGPRELKIYGGGRGRVWERIPEGWVEVRRVGDVRLFEWRR